VKTSNGLWPNFLRAFNEK